VDYLQLPTTDAGRSAEFYRSVFDWRVTSDDFEAPNIIGQWVTDRRPADPAAGPLLWIQADDLYRTLTRVEAAGGTVTQRPYLDHGERWLVEIDDPAGNRLGLVAPGRRSPAGAWPPPRPRRSRRPFSPCRTWRRRVRGINGCSA
jgi:predicted enzyme related to lactoylglutathione lyase